MGPCFCGDGLTELSASSSPFNGYGNCYSFANYPCYRIPIDGAGKNMLTNREDGFFTITEIEVWQVEYLKWDTEKETYSILKWMKNYAIKEKNSFLGEEKKEIVILINK